MRWPLNKPLQGFVCCFVALQRSSEDVHTDSCWFWRLKRGKLEFLWSSTWSHLIFSGRKGGNYLLPGTVLLCHVRKGLLLFGVLIVLLAMFLLLLSLLLFLLATNRVWSEAPGREATPLHQQASRLFDLCRTASLACLSFSLSARTLCCSALSARRFSCKPCEPMLGSAESVSPQI